MAHGSHEAVSPWRVVRRLMGYWASHAWALVGVTLCALTSVAVSVTAPLVIGMTIDECFSFADGSLVVNGALLLRFSLLLAGIYLLGFGIGWLQEYAMTALSQRVVGRIRQQMMDHLLRLDVAYHDANGRGDLLSRFVSDADLLRDAMGCSVVQALTTAVTIVSVIVSMLSLSPKLTALVCVSIPIVTLVSRVVVSRSRRSFRRQQQAIGELGAVVEEAIGGVDTIRSLGATCEWVRRFDKLNDEVCEAGVAAQVNSGLLMPILRLLDNAVYLLVAVVGGLMALAGSLSVGSIQAFLLYARQLLRPINMIATQVNSLQSALAGAERIFEMLDQEPSVINAVDAKKPASGVSGLVEFRNVWFAYKGDEWVLKDVSFTARPGQVVAIVGGTGAGKTTLMNLLVRFYDVQRGQILLDGVDIRDYDITLLRDSMAIVQQEPQIFSDTVRANIAYGDPSRQDDASVAQSAAQAMASAFVERLPDAYDALLSRQGESLSGGQKQLLTIASAMHSQAPMLVLDEATSNVDTRTELLLQRAFRNLTEGRTCFIIAHRLSTVRNADLILVLDHGELAEAGSHDELMATDSRYRLLFESQFAL